MNYHGQGQVLSMGAKVLSNKETDVHTKKTKKNDRKKY